MVFSEYPSLIQLLTKTVSRFGERPALQIEENIISYSQFWEQVTNFSKSLRSSGALSGDRIAILLPNIPEFVIAYFGTLLAGCIAVPINNLFKDQEIQYILEDAECKVVVCSEDVQKEIIKITNRYGFQALVIVSGDKESSAFLSWHEFNTQQHSNSQTIEPKLDDTAVVLYTSGTTGRPRGVVLSHQNLSSNALACIETGSVTSKDICVGVLPFYHSFGQTVIMNTCIASGALNVMVPKFDPNLILELLQKNDISIFAAVPTMYKLILDSQQDSVALQSVRLCLSGGAKLDTNVFQEFKDKFGLHIYEGYGLTEASPVVSFNPMDYRRKIGSVGLPLAGIEVKILNEENQELPPNNAGEIVVKGPNLMKGYFNRPEATKEVIHDDMLFTGDIGKIDDEGYLYILDRKGDLIIKGGFNVYPKEVEQIISYHPKVNEVAVLGVPDPIQGEEVKAYISLKPGKRVSKKEIFYYCQEHLANYKCPKYITFLRTLPKNSTGKVLKRKLFIYKKK